jgi:GTP-binding protein
LVITRDTKAYTKTIYSNLPFATFVPIQFFSALKHQKVDQLMNLILKIDQQRQQVIDGVVLKRFLENCVLKHKPTRSRGNRPPRLRSFIQVSTNPPVFKLKVGPKDSVADTYLHFLINQLRKKFEFIGTPINIWVEKLKIK